MFYFFIRTYCAVASIISERNYFFEYGNCKLVGHSANVFDYAFLVAFVIEYVKDLGRLAFHYLLLVLIVVGILYEPVGESLSKFRHVFQALLNSVVLCVDLGFQESPVDASQNIFRVSSEFNKPPIVVDVCETEFLELLYELEVRFAEA